jgi:hypothetical protein
MPLLERVMKGADEELANRVRAVLRLPQTLRTRPAQPAPPSIDAKVMAERSLKAGFVRDALKYLQLAQEDDPADFAVMLKLGWTYNLLHNDRQAIRWFDLARKSSDPKIAKKPTPPTTTCGPPSKPSAPPSGCSRSTPPAGATSSLTPRSRPSCT